MMSHLALKKERKMSENMSELYLNSGHWIVPHFKGLGDSELNKLHIKL